MAYVDFIPEQQLQRFPFPGATYRTDFVKPQVQRAGIAIPPPIAPPPQSNAARIMGLPAHLAPGPPATRTMISIRPAPSYCARCFTPYNAATTFSFCPSCHPHMTAPAASMQGAPSRGMSTILPRLHLSDRAPGPPLSLQPSCALDIHSRNDPNESSSSERFMMSNMLNVVNNVLQERDGDIDSHVPPPLAMPGPRGLVSCLAENTAPGQFKCEIETLPFGRLPSTLSSTTVMSTMTIPPCRSTPPLLKATQCAKCGNDYAAFCIECRDFLCEACITVHQQDHRIVDSPASSRSSSRKMTPPNVAVQSPVELEGFDDNQLPNCILHQDEKLAFFCHMCIEIICKSCVLDHHSHHNCAALKEAYAQAKPDIEAMLGKSQVEINMLDLSHEASEKMTDSVVLKQNEAITEVRKVFQAHQEALAQQEKEVIAQVKSIAELRLKSLSTEREDIHNALESLKSLNAAAEEALRDENRGEMLVAHMKLSEKLQNSHMFALGKSPTEDDSFILKSNVSEARKALSSLCKLTTAPYPPLCTAVGEGLYHPRVNRLCTVILCTKDRSGEPCLDGGERLFVQLKATAGGGGLLPLDIRDNQDGSYSINFRPQIKGEHQLVVAIRGQHISGSPFSLLVDGGREYGRFGVVSQCWGSEGSGNGQFCRPWGICCDQQGNIIVGDRSNHRIQVFDGNGQLIYKFGSEGNRPGQFNRPAGVAVTREGHVVVADKDNHRIQILKIDGTFMFMFGSKGGNDGQMIYPYDVAVNHMDGRIAVTDTGNHRLLIFSHDGILLGKFGYKGYLCGHFDSPRGIAFNDDGHIIVSDFNVHHILVIHPDGTNARILGSQGSGNGQFMRPQGIAVDHMGNFIISDTRNNRIVIMHPTGHFITKFGTSGSAPGQFDRPTSVCVLPDGRIAVVDFGNSRIQLF